MIIKQFDEKYKKQGGIDQLSSMRENLNTLKEISKHFEISIERVRQWMIDFFGEKYDPRKERKEKTIRAIRSLIKKHGIEKAKTFYPNVNKNYLQIAINSFINENDK